MQDIQIKRIIESDVSEDLIQALHKSFPHDEDTQNWELSKVLDFVSDTRNVLIIAFEHKVVAGFIFGWEIPRLEKSRHFYIDEVATAEKFQRQGIATQMLRFLEAHVRSEHYDVMYVLTEAVNLGANKLYKKVADNVEIEQDIVMYEYYLKSEIE